MSSLSSGINSSITVISKDFIDTLAPGIQRTERSRITIGRILAAIIGALAIGGSQLAVMIPGNLIEVVGKSINLLLCPIFGLFYLALFVPFATPFGAYLGALYSLTAAALIAYWDLITGGPPISFQWIPVVALLTTVICSTGFSLLPTRTCSRTRLAVYAVLSVLPLVALLLWVGS
jgi:Na+(H+)/acetate symporter ActP